VQVQKVADHHFQISRSELETLAAKLRAEATAAATQTLTTARTDNGVTGLRIEGIGAKAECGLEANDIVVSVNGVSTTNRAALAQKRDELLKASRLDVTVERGRKPVTLRYDVRD
jgi:S1-C subfamily serine protease